jgi:hypothetical protein
MKKKSFFAGILAKPTLLVLALAFTTAAGLFAQTAADFEVTLTEDGNGAVIVKYIGKVTNTIKIPATIEGLPVREIGASAFSDVGIGGGYLVYEGVHATVVGIPFTVVLPPGLIKIGAEAFYESALTSVVIPDSVTSIGDAAFHSCGYYAKTGVVPLTYSLTSVTLPKGLTTVGNSAFAGNSALKTVVIPNGWTVISEEMFERCSALTAITIPDSVTSIGEKAFMSTGLTSITFGKGLASIGKEAFSNCDKLKTIVIPEWVTEIGVGAFGKCSALTTVTIPDSVESIQLGGTNYSSGRTLMEEAFNGCGKLNLATQARLKKITITTAYEVEQAQKQRENEERKAQEKREQEEREAQAQLKREADLAEQRRIEEERKAQAKLEHEARLAEMRRRVEEIERQQEAHNAEIEKIQHAVETAQALITRLTPIYSVASSRTKPTKQQFNEFIAIYPDYIAAKNNYDSLGLSSGHPSHNDLNLSYKTLENYVRTIIGALDKSQKKTFDTKFK